MTERRTVWKWFWAWDYEKEERWLNEMAQSGWALADVHWCRYVFEACEPGEWIIRLEMHRDDPAYLSLLEEIGAVPVARWFQWIYLRRPVRLGSFDLFSDLDSRINHLNGVCRVLACIGVGNLLIGVGNTLGRSPLGLVNLLLGTLLMYGLGRLHGKRDELLRERQLRE